MKELYRMYSSLNESEIVRGFKVVLSTTAAGRVGSGKITKDKYEYTLAGSTRRVTSWPNI